MDIANLLKAYELQAKYLNAPDTKGMFDYKVWTQWKFLGQMRTTDAMTVYIAKATELLKQ